MLAFVRTTNGFAAEKEKTCAACRRSPSAVAKTAVQVSEWPPCEHSWMGGTLNRFQDNATTTTEAHQLLV